MRILIVEDERLLAETVKTLLESRGFTAETAYDGESGLAYGELGIYDLIILDVMLPGLDGRQVVRRLREKRCGTPVLMLTARSGLEDRVEGLNAGADYYLAKPFDARELLACVNALLRRQGGQVDELRMGNTSLDLAARCRAASCAGSPRRPPHGSPRRWTRTPKPFPAGIRNGEAGRACWRTTASGSAGADHRSVQRWPSRT